MSITLGTYATPSSSNKALPVYKAALGSNTISIAKLDLYYRDYNKLNK